MSCSTTCANIAPPATQPSAPSGAAGPPRHRTVPPGPFDPRAGRRFEAAVVAQQPEESSMTGTCPDLLAALSSVSATWSWTPCRAQHASRRCAT